MTTIVIDPEKIKQTQRKAYLISFRISNQEKDKLQAYCIKNNLRYAELIRNLLNEFFNANSK